MISAIHLSYSNGAVRKGCFVTIENDRPMNYFKLWCFFVLVIVCRLPLQAQDWVSYQSQQKINDLVDTGTELLMATDAGLVVMNKATLEKTIFNKANTSLSNNHIQSITQAPNGSYWIGTYDVVMGRFDGTNFSETTVPDIAEYNEHTKLYDFEIAPNGDFWLGTSDGVFHRQGEVWSHYGQEELGAIFFEAWDVEILPAGEVLIASHTIHKYTEGTWSNLSDTTELLGYLDAALFRSSAGDLYFAGDLDRIGRFTGEAWQMWDNGGLNGSEITGFTEDAAGAIYFNTKYDGVFKLEGDTWNQQVNPQTSAFANQTNYFYIDALNQRWLNSKIYLSVDRQGSIQSTIISSHTLASNSINNLHKGEDGNMYFLLADRSISLVNPAGDWSFLSPMPSLLPFENLNDLLVLADQTIWLATDSGLHFYNGSEWERYELGPCRSFAQDSQGTIYASANDRIYKISDGEITQYNTNNSSLSTHIISGMGVDAEDNLWIASFSWEGDNVIQTVSTEGTWTTYLGSEHPVLNNRPIGDFYFDHQGNVWIPADQVGAIKFDGQAFTNPVADHLTAVANPDVFSIAGDASGKLYFAHQYGVTTLLNDEWEDLLIEDVPNVTSSSNAKIQFDDAGTLWWASNRQGVFSYTPIPATTVLEGFEKSHDLRIYPNPAADYSMLRITLQEKAQASTSIYNQLGQLVAVMDLGQLAAGTSQQPIDLSRFPKGTYYVKLQINGDITTRMLIVQ